MKKFLITYTIGGQAEWEADDNEQAMQEAKLAIKMITAEEFIDAFELDMESVVVHEAEEVE